MVNVYGHRNSERLGVNLQENAPSPQPSPEGEGEGSASLVARVSCLRSL
jgi:hypothetical protein